MRGAVEAALLLAAGLVAVEGTLCRPGHSWWSSEKDTCLNCTLCDSERKAFVVLRPCQINQDTVCGLLADLGIDWSWLRRARNDHRHLKARKEQRRRQDELAKNSTANYGGRKIIWRFSPPEGDSDAQNQTEAVAEEVTAIADYDADAEVRSGSESFSDDEFVWDWETVVLILVVLSCLLFFVVIGIYSLYHAKQWRILKENLEADVEGLTAKLSLMMSAAEVNRFNEATAPPGSENQYSNLRCSYLEQLLAGKSKGRPLGPGNVYIQENNSY